jgi:hypothetical protein
MDTSLGMSVQGYNNKKTKETKDDTKEEKSLC